jgi:uncharacterized protein (DUF1697 family)
MPKLAAFLRAINVGGRTVKMDQLCAIFAAAGFGEVRTLLASGNVVFEAKGGPAAAMRTRVEAALRKALGYEVAAMLRTRGELEAVLGQAAFAEGAAAKNVLLLERALNADEQARVRDLESAQDRLIVDGAHVYWLCSVRQSESMFSNVRFEKALSVRATIRTLKTIERVAAALAD